MPHFKQGDGRRQLALPRVVECTLKLSNSTRSGKCADKQNQTLTSCARSRTSQWFQQFTVKSVPAADRLTILGLSQGIKKYVRRARSVWPMYSSMQRNRITARGVVLEEGKNLCHKLRVRSLPPKPFRRKRCVIAFQLSDSSQLIGSYHVPIQNEIHEIRVQDEVCIYLFFLLY